MVSRMSSRVKLAMDFTFVFIFEYLVMIYDMAGTLLFYIHEIDFVYRNGNLARIDRFDKSKFHRLVYQKCNRM